MIAQLVKNPPAMQETPFDSWVRKICWRRDRLPTPVFWPREFQGLYSPWGHKELDMTEQLSLHSFTHSESQQAEKMRLVSQRTILPELKSRLLFYSKGRSCGCLLQTSWCRNPLFLPGSSMSTGHDVPLNLKQSIILCSAVLISV